MTMNTKSLTSMKHWQAPIVGVLGVWLAVSPWVVGPTGSDLLSASCVALGVALVASAAAMAFPARAAWGAWLSVVVGLLAAVSPWLLGFSEQSDATINASAAGLVAAILGFMVGLASSDPDGWWNDRVAG
jgi:hypothetical protein